MEPRTKAGQALWAKLVESIDSGDLHVDKDDILAIEAEAAMPSLPAVTYDEAFHAWLKLPSSKEKVRGLIRDP